MNVELKRIAEKKLEQMGATVHGVLVKNEAGAWAAVSEGGRVMWLDDFEGQAARAQGGVVDIDQVALETVQATSEIDRLKAQLKEYEEKGRVLMDISRDLKGRVRELETMVKVFRGCIETGEFPESLSPCHHKIIELVGGRDG